MESKKSKLNSSLIAVLQSNAPLKEKFDACRELGRIGSADAVEPLAALLGDDELSHMARYGLEPNPDPSVDKALRNALGKLKGRLLSGVIGSIGVRRDTKGVKPLAKFLQHSDTVVAEAAARALGNIGNAAAAKELEKVLPDATAANRRAVCEGLFRCAESMESNGKRKPARAIYDRLREFGTPHQIRGGALRGSVLTRGRDGLPLLLEAIRSDDFTLVRAAARTAQEMHGAGVCKALADELGSLSVDKQVLIIQTLGKRGNAAALHTLLDIAKSGDKAVRIAAIRALPEIGNTKAAPMLRSLQRDADAEIAQAAKESMAAF